MIPEASDRRLEERRETRHVVLLGQQRPTITSTCLFERTETQDIKRREAHEEIKTEHANRHNTGKKNNRRRCVEQQLLPALKIGQHGGKIVHALRERQAARE